MELFEKIDEYCEENVTLHGFADLREYKNQIYSDFLKKYDYAITIGVNIPDDIVEDLNSDDGRFRYMDAYNGVNALLNDVAENIVEIIKDDGYDAVNVNSSKPLPGANFAGDISHKLVANLAGMGWIGKSALLINPYYGPRVRWATILTDADLPVVNKRMKSRCNTCRLCVVNCPANSFDDVEFDENIPRDERYDAQACSDFLARRGEEGFPRMCGFCVKVCPWGLVNKNSRVKEDVFSLD